MSTTSAVHEGFTWLSERLGYRRASYFGAIADESATHGTAERWRWYVLCFCTHPTRETVEALVAYLSTHDSCLIHASHVVFSTPRCYCAKCERVSK